MEIKVFATGSEQNLYLVRSGNDSILIECGMPLSRLQEHMWEAKEHITDLDGCFVSHEHGDHSYCAKRLIKYGVDMYMAEDTAIKLEILGHRRVFPLPLEVTEYRSTRTGNWKFKSFPAVHDVPCLGFVIDHNDNRLLYLTDSEYNPFKVPGVTHIMIGVNFSPEMMYDSVNTGITDIEAVSRILHNHASYKTVIDMLEANDLSRCQEIHLLHISKRNGDPRAFEKGVASAYGIPVYTY